MQTNTNNINNK